MTLCKFQGMEECAKQYCDFWNQRQKMCSIALESHERVELLQHLNRVLKKIEQTNQTNVTTKFINHLASLNMRTH